MLRVHGRLRCCFSAAAAITTTTRGIHASTIRADGPVRKVTKTLAELPTTHAPPLPRWTGGLERAEPDYDTDTNYGDGSLDTSGSNARMVKLAHDVANSRPPLASAKSSGESAEFEEDGPVEMENTITTKRRPGRPKKRVEPEYDEDTTHEYSDATVADLDLDESADAEPAKPRRGRPPRSKSSSEEDLSGLIVSSADSGDVLRLKHRPRVKPIDASAADEELSEPSTEAEPDAPRTALQASILANLARFPHCILLTRVGQFYESYFSQAPLVSQLLGLKLASRVFSKQRVPMCGFPIGYLHKHLRTLVVGNGRFVALCEEFPRPGSEFGAKVSFERRVVRVVTPGTLIDEPFLNPYENNYLLSITPGTTESNSGEADIPIGLAWIDVSTGEFFSRATTADALRNELVRLAPKEVVLPASFKDDPRHAISAALAEEGCFVSYAEPALDDDSDPERIVAVDAIPPDDLALATAETESVFDASTERSPHESSAITQLTSYLRANLLEHAPILSASAASASTPRMSIDAHTLKALEIREGMREGGTTGSVLSAVDRTRTRGGARLLTRWLCAPSASLPEIQARQALVALFRAPAREALRTELTVLLREAGDAPRAVQRFALGRGGPGDLAALGSTLGAWNAIRRRIELERGMEMQERGEAFDASEWASLDALMSRLDGVEALAEQVRLALPPVQDAEEEEMDTGDSDESPLDSEPGSEMKYQTGSKWSINPQFSPELVQLHSEIEGLLDAKYEMELELRQAYTAPSLTLRSSLSQGLHVHLARKRQAGHIKASSDFIPVSESGTTMAFFNSKWSRLGTRIMEASQALMLAERQAFESLRQAVVNEEAALRRNARIVDELDVTLSFAHIAHEMNWVQPTMTNDLAFNVVNGRHPTVELGLLTAGRMFTPNTVSFSPDSRLHVITGPNMAGKSTLLRQTALITILAQVGSFVPADSATIGVVDKLYSRVGAKDDLFRDRSTFMVEMLETAEILRRATPNSLVIMDEVGRGTTMKDGLAIAFATVHHLYTQNRCRALFATHFHELTDMLGYSPEHKGEGFFENVGFFCTDVDELQGGGFSYSHRLRPGVNRDSHGLKVAQLAGLPPEAVSVAREALSWLKDNSSDSTSQRDRLKTLGQSLADTSP